MNTLFTADSLPNRMEVASEIHNIYHALGKRLFALAGIGGRPCYQSKTALIAAINATRNRKRIPVARAVTLIRQVEALARQVRTARRTRTNGGTYRSVRLSSLKTVWDTPLSTRVAELKWKRRADLISTLYRETQSSWVGGERKIDVLYGPEPLASGRSEIVWHKRETRSGTNSHLAVTFSPTWWNDVVKEGLEVIDGMLTTHARQIKPNVYEAAWVEQGKGFSLRAVRGYIVRNGRDVAHGRTEAAARRSLHLRDPNVKADLASRREHRARQMERGLTLIRSYMERLDTATCGNILVSFQDSLDAGNCDSGTRNWLNRHFGGRTQIPISEVISIPEQRHLAIAACLQSIRRHARTDADLCSYVHRLGETVSSIAVNSAKTI